MLKKLTATCLLAASLCLAACQSSASPAKETSGWEQIKASGTMTVATSGTLYPASYHNKDNELTGYEVEIMREVAQRLDVEVKFEEMGVDGMLSALDSGQIDIAAYYEPGNKGASKFLQTTPHKYSFTSMIVRQKDNSGIETLEDIKGKKAAGAASTSYMKVAKKLGAELVIYDNVTNDVYMNDLVSGRTDVIINDYYLQKIAVAALPDTPVKILEGLYFNPTNASYSISKRNQDLLDEVDAALEAMRKDGTMKKLSEEFFAGEDVSVDKHYDLDTVDYSDID